MKKFTCFIPCFAVLSLLSAKIEAQVTVSIQGVQVSVVDDTLFIRGSLLARSNSVYGENLNNSGTLIVTDSLKSSVDGLFRTSTANARGMVMMEGNKEQVISGNHTIFMNNLTIDNLHDAKLDGDVCLLGCLKLSGSSLFLNNHSINCYDLSPEMNASTGRLELETDRCQVYDTADYPAGGQINSYAKAVNSNPDPGNLGAMIDKPSGDIFIERGHGQIRNAGQGSIRKYFNIHSSDGQSFGLKFLYLDSFDLRNTQLKEKDLGLFSSPFQPGIYYYKGGEVDTLYNLVMQTDLVPGSQYTLSDAHCPDPPPIAFTRHEIEACTGEKITLSSSYVSFLHYWTGKQLGEADTTSRLIVDNVLPGSSTYILTVFDKRGCINRDSIIVKGHPVPVAAFSLPKSICQQDTIKPVNHSIVTDGPAIFSWIINDQDSLTGTSIAIPANLPGECKLRLIARSTYGCTDEASSTVNIEPLPQAVYSAHDLCLAYKLLFENKSSIAKDAEIILSRWYIDGKSAGVIDYPNQLNSFPWEFPSAGNYQVALEVLSDKGCKSSHEEIIHVYDPPRADFIQSGHCERNKVEFTALCSGGAEPSGYLWMLGNEMVTTAPSYSIEQSSPGLHTLSLLYTTANNCKDSTTRDFTVYTLPSPAFDYTGECVGQPVVFKSLSSDSLQYQWNINGEILHNQVTSVTIEQPGFISASLHVLSSEGCSDSLTREIEIHPIPEADFQLSPGCEGDSLTIAPTYLGSIASASWLLDGHFISNDLNLHIPHVHAGSNILSLRITNTYGCERKIEKILDAKKMPVVSLPRKVSTCGSQYTLDAGPNGISYLWSTHETSRKVTVLSSGDYLVSVIGEDGCEAVDTCSLRLNTVVSPDLGPDRLVCDSTVLHSGYPDAFNEWSGGETSESIQVVHSGNISVRVLDQNGCEGSDSVFITVHPSPIPEIGGLIETCGDSSILLGSFRQGWTYRWSDGSDNAILEVTKSGIYSCRVTDADGCSSSGSMQVQFFEPPISTMPVQLKSCGEAIITVGPAGQTYSWNDGSTLSSRTLSSAGLYIVKSKNAHCSRVDSMQLQIIRRPEFSLGDDLILCEGTVASVAPVNADHGFAWTWNTGATSPLLNITHSGIYTLTARNAEGCSFSDSISIHFIASPAIALESTYLLCPGDTILLCTGTNESETFLWEEGNQILSTHACLEVHEACNPTITARDSYGCETRKSISVTQSPKAVYSRYLVASEAHAGDTLIFINFSQPEPFSSFWDYGDGIAGIETDAAHIYQRSDRYQSSLRVNNSFCDNQASKSILILPDVKSGKLNADSESDPFVITSYRVFPNPSKDRFSVLASFSKPATAMLCLYNMNGLVIYKESFKSQEEISSKIDCHSLPTGVYLLLLSAEGETHERRIIILH